MEELSEGTIPARNGSYADEDDDWATDFDDDEDGLQGFDLREGTLVSR